MTDNQFPSDPQPGDTPDAVDPDAPVTEPLATDAAPEADQADATASDKDLERLERMSAKEFGDLALKFASDTAYAAAGFADMVGQKARDYADKQRAAAAESGETPTEQTKAFFEQVSAQMNKVFEEMGHAYKDLAERGRDAISKMQQQASEKPEPKDVPGMFDIVDDAETADASTETEDPSQPEAGAESDVQPEPKRAADPSPDQL